MPIMRAPRCNSRDSRHSDDAFWLRPRRHTCPVPPSFDMSKTVIMFHWWRFLGRGAASDAAGRARSLRGPRRVFFCAHCASAGSPIPRKTAKFPAFGPYDFVDSRIRSAYKRVIAAVPLCRALSASSNFCMFQRFFVSERPHECQIGSGDYWSHDCPRGIREPLTKVFRISPSRIPVRI